MTRFNKIAQVVTYDIESRKSPISITRDIEEFHRSDYSTCSSIKRALGTESRGLMFESRQVDEILYLVIMHIKCHGSFSKAISFVSD